MIIYPAIDIRNGKCVRLTQGNYNEQQTYSDSPADVATGFANAGAKYIHTVDLDGAKEGVQQNIKTIRSIVEAVSVPVQLGGGIRTMESIDELVAIGVSRIILGTAAVEIEGFVQAAVKNYGDRIAVGIDARDGMVAIEGWTRTSSLKAVEFGKKMRDLGVKTIIYTDISRDGMLQGPNLAAMSEMVQAVGGNVDVIASGGVSTLADIRELKATGVSGAIVGKALYTGNIKLEDALRIAFEEVDASC